MPEDRPDRSAEADRRRRLAEALRENLKRRKSQSRGRRAGGPELTRPGPAQGEPKREDE